MALQTFNFLNAQGAVPSHSSIGGALSSYLKGYEGRLTPSRLEEEQKQRELATALKQVEANYAEPTARADLQHKNLVNQYYGPEKEATIAHQRLVNQYYPELTQAQIQHYKDQAAGRTFAPSSLGKLIQERNDIAAKDPNDPMLAEYDRVIKSTGGKKFAPTGLGKLYTERQEVEAGFLPGSNGEVPLNAAQQQQLLDAYDLKIQKDTSDATNREQVIQGQNLIKSQDASDLGALVNYSGPTGYAKLLKDKAASLTGKPSKEYLDYVKAQAAAHLEVDEYRQFLGTSITPEARKALEDLINPSTFMLGKEEARQKIQKARDTIKKQVQTRIDALQSTRPYVGGKSNAVPNDFAAVIKNAGQMEAQGSQPKLFGNLQLEDDGSQ